MDIETFYYQFVNDPWCDIMERPKLSAAIKTLIERVPDDVLEDLPSVTLLAPSPWKYGQANPFPQVQEGDALIYLSPALEAMEQDESDFVLAHEIAHVHLRHHTFHSMLSDNQPTEYLDSPQELEADALVKNWGYPVPARRHRKDL